MSAKDIKFGTDGWRGVIAKNFTFENINIVALATAEQFLEDLKTNNKVKNLVYIGYDRRFLGKEFAERTAIVLSQKGLNVNLYNVDVPTPMVSFDVRKNSAVGGIVITASHNPYQFSGFKIKQPDGNSAAKDYTSKVEARLDKVNTAEIDLEKGGNYNLIDESKDYLDFISKTLDIEALKNIDGTVVIDPMFGVGKTYVEDFLKGGKLKLKTIRSYRDVTFGGMNPEPMMPQLTPLCEEVVKEKALMGLATDGDADRVGGVDENGSYINTHKILSIFLYYLVEKKKMNGGVVVTFSQSVLVKRMAKHYGLKVFEVPIGFKYIADLMINDDILVGGEEANGIGSKLHFMPDRDGIFNSLLLLEAVNAFGKKPSELIEELHEKFGAFYYDRVDLHIPSTTLGKEFVEDVKKNPPKEINGQKVVDVQSLDGTKVIFEDDSWLLFRPSGTEPLLRIYSEACSTDRVKTNLEFAQGLFKEMSTATV